jgi:hypothetical protein
MKFLTLTLATCLYATGAWAHSSLKIDCTNSTGENVFSYDEHDGEVVNLKAYSLNLKSFKSAKAIRPILVLNHSLPGQRIYQIMDKSSTSVIATLSVKASEMVETDADGGSVATWASKFPAQFIDNNNLDWKSGELKDRFGNRASSVDSDFFSADQPKFKIEQVSCVLHGDYA